MHTEHFGLVSYSRSMDKCCTVYNCTLVEEIRNGTAFSDLMSLVYESYKL